MTCCHGFSSYDTADDHLLKESAHFCDHVGAMLSVLKRVFSIARNEKAFERVVVTGRMDDIRHRIHHSMQL